jgi:hypothetical protein
LYSDQEADLRGLHCGVLAQHCVAGVMRKPKQDWIGELSPWDIEVVFYEQMRGIDPDKARIATIIRWMENGDLRPLAAAIEEVGALDKEVLSCLAELISNDRITVRPRRSRRGAPKKLGKFARDLVAALAYQTYGTGSDETFATIAEQLRVSEQTVRQAVTKFRKANSKLASK